MYIVLYLSFLKDDGRKFDFTVNIIKSSYIKKKTQNLEHQLLKYIKRLLMEKSGLRTEW